MRRTKLAKLIAGVAMAILLLTALAPASGRVWKLAATTSGLIVAVELFSLSGGILLAQGLAHLPPRSRDICRALLFAMVCVPLYVHVAAWQAGFGLQGWQAAFWRQSPWLLGFWGAAWVHGVHAVYWVALIVSLAIERTDTTLLEIASLDLPPRQAWRRAVWPQLVPTIVGVAAWLAVLVAGEMAVTDMFQVRTYAEELYTELAVGGEPGMTPLSAWPGVVAASLGLLAASVVARAWTITARSASSRRPIPLSRGGGEALLKLAVVVVVAVLVLAPLSQLAYQAGLDSRLANGARSRTWSAVKLLEVIAQSPLRFQQELRWSARLGVLSATLTMALATPLAWRARTSAAARRGAAIAVLVSLSMPGPVVGLLLIRAFDRPEIPWFAYLYDHSLAAPVAALVWRTLGVAVLLVSTSLASIPGTLIEAAANHGLSPARQLAWVAAPLAWRSLAFAWLASFALAIGELSASVLVVPPRVTTVAIRIATLTHYGVDDQLAALCLTVSLLSGVIAATAFLVAKRPQ